MSTKERYTDQELCQATQIAYFNIDKKLISDYFISHGDYPTLQEIVAEQGPGIYYSYGKLQDATGDKLKMRQSVEEFCAKIVAGEECVGWKIVSVSDTNTEDGFYGITIETGNNNAPTEQQLKVA